MSREERIEALVAEGGGDELAEAVGADGPEGAAEGDSAAGGDNAVVPEGEPGGANDEAATRRSLLRERLEDAKERRKAASLLSKAKQQFEAAETARSEAEAERARVRAAIEGGWKTGLAEVGWAPHEVIEGMTREALDAQTPEAMQRTLQKLVESQVSPLQAKIDAYEAERQRHQEQRAAWQQEQAVANFSRAVEVAVKAPEYEVLDIYEPGEIVGIAHAMAENLTAQGETCTVKDILDVLKQRQEEYEERHQRRLTKRQSPGASGPPRMVNGTVPRAGSVLGNALASEGGSARKLSRDERIELLIKRQG